MDDDHAADSLLICRRLGGRPDATAARVAGADRDGIDFMAMVAGVEVPVRLPWAAPIAPDEPNERSRIRDEVVQLYRDASAP